MTPPQRVDKYLRDCTHQPLAALRVACSEGRVAILVSESLGQSRSCSRVITRQDELVFDGDQVELDGRPIVARPSKNYLALNKPQGITSSAADPDGFEDLSAWLRDMPEGVFPVGRLDRMTSGLLLFTNDGDFANALLHPQHHVAKHYRLLVRECVDPRDPRVSLLVQGVELPGHTALLRAVSATVVRCSSRETELWLRLNEGKHRQIRKMCHALNLPLIGLHRQGIGSVQLAALAPGDTRALTPTEVEALWSEAGGRELVRRRQVHALERRAALARKLGTPLLRLEQWLGSALSSVLVPDLP